MGLDCCGLFHRFILAVIVIKELLRAWQLIKNGYNGYWEK
jgi:hypothetical protein